MVLFGIGYGIRMAGVVPISAPLIPPVSATTMAAVRETRSKIDYTNRSCNVFFDTVSSSSGSSREKTQNPPSGPPGGGNRGGISGSTSPLPNNNVMYIRIPQNKAYDHCEKLLESANGIKSTNQPLEFRDGSLTISLQTAAQACLPNEYLENYKDASLLQGSQNSVKLLKIEEVKLQKETLTYLETGDQTNNLSDLEREQVLSDQEKEKLGREKAVNDLCLDGSLRTNFGGEKEHVLIS